jgi:hypothetical protein
VVEHRIARLVQLGIRQARYRGHAKTLFQVAMAAAVANLTLVTHRADPALSLAAVMALGMLLVALRSNQTAFWGLPRPFAITTPDVPIPALARLSDFPGNSHKRLLRPNF